jgi:lactam utilization protein B
MMVVKDRARAVEHVIAPALQEELRQYAGQWVALTATKIVAVGNSPQATVDLATERGYKRPLLFRVPPDGNLIFLL